MTKFPKYRKHSTGQAFIELAGKRIYLGPYGTAVSKREYDRVLSEWLASGRQQPAEASQGFTVEELLAAWAKFAELHYRRSDGSCTPTFEGMKPPLRTLRKLFGQLDVNSFGPLALKQVREFVIANGAITKKGSPSGVKGSRQYANTVVNTIRQIFRWGVGEELVKPETWHGLQAVQALQAGRTVAKESEQIRPIDDEAIEKTIPHL